MIAKRLFDSALQRRSLLKISDIYLEVACIITIIIDILLNVDHLSVG